MDNYLQHSEIGDKYAESQHIVKDDADVVKLYIRKPESRSAHAQSSQLVSIRKRDYLFVTDIINVTATMAMHMPTIMLVVSGAPNIIVPTKMAVIGSKTPSTEAFVAPMLRVAMASVAVETIVGSSAKPTKLSQALPPSIPAVIVVSENRLIPKKTTAPTVKA